MEKFIIGSFILLLFLLTKNAFPNNNTYEIIIQKNIFSPSRRYNPSEKSSAEQEVVPWKEVFLRGTFKQDHTWWAIFEVSPAFAQKWHLSRKQLILKIGQKLGPCEIRRITSGEVILGGSCGETKITLSENPERRQPLKKPSSFNFPEKPKKKSSLDLIRRLRGRRFLKKRQ